MEQRYEPGLRVDDMVRPKLVEEIPGNEGKGILARHEFEWSIREAKYVREVVALAWAETPPDGHDNRCAPTSGLQEGNTINHNDAAHRSSALEDPTSV